MSPGTDQIDAEPLAGVEEADEALLLQLRQERSDLRDEISLLIVSRVFKTSKNFYIKAFHEELISWKADRIFIEAWNIWTWTTCDQSNRMKICKKKTEKNLKI